MANYQKEVYGHRGGEMSWDMFPDKLEATPMPETDDDLSEIMDYHMRGTLKDFSTDLPSKASDLPREHPGVPYGILTLRETGTRSGIAPENPDLFLEFTDRDLRGTLTEPNGEEMRRQDWHRKAMLEPTFYDDSDNSVPSSGIHPNTLYPNMRRTQPWMAAHLKVFGTEYDAFQHGGVVEIPHSHELQRMIDSEDQSLLKDIRHEPERANMTTIISNNFDIGYRQSTDHQFKVSKYGQIYSATPHMTLASQMQYVDPDHNLPQMSEAEGKVYTLGAFMKDATKLYQSNEVSGEFGGSIDNKVKINKTQENISKILNQIVGSSKREQMVGEGRIYSATPHEYMSNFNGDYSREFTESFSGQNIHGEAPKEIAHRMRRIDYYRKIKNSVESGQRKGGNLAVGDNAQRMGIFDNMFGWSKEAKSRKSRQHDIASYHNQTQTAYLPDGKIIGNYSGKNKDAPVSRGKSSVGDVIFAVEKERGNLKSAKKYSGENKYARENDAVFGDNKEHRQIGIMAPKSNNNKLSSYKTKGGKEYQTSIRR